MLNKQRILSKQTKDKTKSTGTRLAKLGFKDFKVLSKINSSKNNDGSKIYKSLSHHGSICHWIHFSFQTDMVCLSFCLCLCQYYLFDPISSHLPVLMSTNEMVT